MLIIKFLSVVRRRRTQIKNNVRRIQGKYRRDTLLWNVWMEREWKGVPK